MTADPFGCERDRHVLSPMAAAEVEACEDRTVAAIHREADALDAYVAQVEAKAHAFAGVYATALTQPMKDTVDDRVWGKFATDVTKHTHRLTRRHGRPPTVHQLVEELSYWLRYTPKAAGQVLAYELAQHDAMVQIATNADPEADWLIEVQPRWLPHAMALADAFDVIERAMGSL